MKGRPFDDRLSKEMQETKNKRYTEGPYEKYLKLGARQLSDAELLAVILRTGTVGEDTVSIANKVLSLPGERQKGILGLHHVSLKELMSVRGIGQVKAIKLKCIAELSSRIAQQTAKKTLQMTDPATVADYYMERLRHSEREKVILLMTDNRNHLIAEHILSEGTVNASLISPREIFLTALRLGAVYIMLLHNHPAGDPTPGRQDIAATEKIKKAAELIEIPLIDHIIIGDKKYFSFREMGYL
ncbi:MAG: DNA repair protein RadC [Lachnospiraceae bacterium]|nr:DNA repair protein RadC [Lachnospiraceae bacterium]